MIARGPEWAAWVDELPAVAPPLLVEGSTRRWEADAEGMRATLAAHDEAMTPVINTRDGYSVESHAMVVHQRSDQPDGSGDPGVQLRWVRFEAQGTQHVMYTTADGHIPTQSFTP